MIGKFMAEAIGEGAFLALLKNAWKWAVRIVGSMGIVEAAGRTIGDEIKKRYIDPKGWGDENYFALDLAEANITPDQKKMIKAGMVLAEEVDKRDNTAYAANFRILVTFNDENKPSNPGAPATATAPAVPASVRPGITIVEDLANSCATADEVLMHIMALGAMHDASSNAEKFFLYAKDKLLPILLEKGKLSLQAIISFMENKNTFFVEKVEARKNRSSWKKWLLN